ncbi:hypothetical protein X726_28515 [Mesorhizobium sp. L103C105A0]|nr:hypothetical protein X726_28515 [Mesorhizobium sp. L103C105A0]
MRVCTRDDDRQMQLSASGAADEHGIALVGDKGAVGELADKGLVDRRVGEVEFLDLLGERQLGDDQLVFDGARLLAPGSSTSASPGLRPTAMSISRTARGRCARIE